MKLSIFKILLFTFAYCNIQIVNADTKINNLKAKVNFIDGNKFIDYRLTNYSRNKSLKILKKDFSKVFSQLSSEYLKDGQSISINVTNLDLAGDIRFNVRADGQDIRVIKDISPLKLYFTYKLLTIDGDVVAEGDYKLKEFLHLGSSMKRLKHRGNLSHFIPFLEKWFVSEFSQAS